MESSTSQLGPDDFAAKIKAQHPAYAKVPNEELSKKVLAKYPQYWQHVDAAKFAAKGLYQPASSGTKTESTGKTHPESMMGKNMTSAVGAASPVLATAGALAGSAAGPPGAIAGAAAGGAAGEAITEHAEGKVSPGKIALAGAEQGALEYVGGQVVPKMLERVGKSAVPKVLKAVNNYLGIKPTSLPKWMRSADTAEDVAKTVLSEAGVKKTLPLQRDAIEAARLQHQIETERIVQTPAGRSTDIHALVKHETDQMLDDMKLEVHTPEAKAAIQANKDAITKVGSAQKTPGETFDLRKSIGSRVTDWNPEEQDVKNRYLVRVYHSLNDAITKGLPPSEATEFRLHNLMQNRLIIARDAANKTILGQVTKKTPGIVTKTVNRLGGGAVGALSGSMIAGETGGNREHGAIVGGLIGAGLGSYARHLGTAEHPAADIAAQRAIAKAAPYLAKAGKAIPTGARATQAIIESIQSRPQGGP